MKNKSQVPRAIAELGIKQQVALSVESLPTGGLTPADLLTPTAEGSGKIYVRLGVPMPVEIKTEQGCVQMRGKWEGMHWADYSTVALGLRKLIAGGLNVEPTALTSESLIAIDGEQAFQYVEIVIPSNLEAEFARVDTQASVEVFLHAVKGEQRLHAGSQSTDDQLDVSDIDAGDPPLAVLIAHEVRAAIGGKTLPAACFIASPRWEEPLELSGRIGDRPKVAPSEPKDITIDCRIDGYIKSKRQVHLLPLLSSDAVPGGATSNGRKIVAFDEERWFPEIARLAAIRSQTVRATYQQVLHGSKEMLTLLGLDQIPAAGDSSRHS